MMAQDRKKSHLHDSDYLLKIAEKNDLKNFYWTQLYVDRNHVHATKKNQTNKNKNKFEEIGKRLSIGLYEL